MCAFMDITDMMSEKELTAEQQSSNEEHDAVVDGELIASLQCGNVVELKDSGRMMFILMIDREAGMFLGTPVELTEHKNAIRTIPSRNEIENGEMIKITRNPEYIGTDRIETVPLEQVNQIRGRGPVSATAHLEVLNKILSNFDYDGVAKKYDELAEGITYESFEKDLQLQKINIKTTADPQVRLITVLKKQLDKANSELVTAKSYKETSKKELSTLKKDNSCLKKDCEAAKLKAEKSVKEKEKYEKDALEIAAKCEELTGKYNKLLEENHELEAKVSAEKETGTIIASLNEDNENLRNQLAERDCTISDIQAQNTELLDIKKSYLVLGAEMQAKMAKINELENELSRLRKDLKNPSVKSRRQEELSALEYNLSYESCGDKNSFVMIPANAEEKLSTLLEAVPVELQAQFLSDMVDYFEKSLKSNKLRFNIVKKIAF